MSPSARLAAVIIFILAAAVPFVASNYIVDVGLTIITYAILGLGLNIVVGYAGLLDLGYAAFFAIGAYTTALLETLAGFSFWDTLPFALALTAVSGVIIGYPTLRLRSDYLAIVTLGFGEIVRITATNLSITGGPNGIYGINPPTIFGFEISSPRQIYELGMGFLLIVLAFAIRLSISRLGRAWAALREDESAAEAVGVPTLFVKLLAYVMGALVGGFGGSLFSARFGTIDPTAFTYLQSVTILIIVVLGGRGSIPGVILGAVLVAGIPEALRFLNLWRILGFAIALIVLMLLRPQGLWPARPRRPPVPKPDTARQQLPRLGEAGRPGEVLLEVTNLRKVFGGVTAVANVSFHVLRGEILSVIGPNGAGKTSVFNCLTGITRPTSGSIVWLGRSITGHSPHRVVHLGIARTFQGIRLFPALTAFENVLVGMDHHARASLAGQVLSLPGARHEEEAHHEEAIVWLDFVGLAVRAGERAADLPYGDQRRLEIARALASRPQLLLLDEPAAGMNPTEKVALMSLIRAIRDLGITVTLIEHDMMLVMGISDRIVVMDRGAVIAEGSPAAIQADRRVIDAYLGTEKEEEAEEDEGGAPLVVEAGR
jgi:branched-chain amino acid transport system ATP-binding protein/branched-chain amino acid transport system permease protein